MNWLSLRVQRRLVAASLTVLGLGTALAAQGGPGPGGGPGNPPPPLPSVPVPAGDPITPAKAVLGKILFWDEQLSSNNRVACGTCHLPAFGGGDARRALHPGRDGVAPSPDDTFGSPGTVRSDVDNDYLPSAWFGLREQVTDRASPSFFMAAWFPRNFWDGRAGPQFVDPESGRVVLAAGGALEQQALAPVTNAVEMAHDGRLWGEVTAKLAGARPLALATDLPPDTAAAIAVDPTYPDLFAAAFGDPAITAERIARAIATYERTLVPDQSPYDRFVAGVPGALTPAQFRGLNLFGGPGRCVVCHSGGLFSDGQFHNLGLRPIAQDPGRQAVTGDPLDAGRFKTPSLRNAGLRRSFMHTGQFTSLAGVIDFYAAGGGPNLANKDPALVPLRLDPAQRADLAAFVGQALTDPRVAAEQFPFDRPTLLAERLPPAGLLFGAGSPGSGGRVPDLLAGVPANVGNVDFKLGLGNALGAAPAVLAVAGQSAPPGTLVGGTRVQVDLAGALLLPLVVEGPALPGGGFGTVRYPLPADPALGGLVLFAQAFVFDPGASGLAASTRGAVVEIF